MGAPLGNKNASRENRQFRNSLNRNLKRFKAEGVPDGDALGKITQKLIQCAINGEAWAIKEVADRLEVLPQAKCFWRTKTVPLPGFVTRTKVVNVYSR